MPISQRWGVLTTQNINHFWEWEPNNSPPQWGGGWALTVQGTGQLLTTDNHSVRFDSYINKKENCPKKFTQVKSFFFNSYFSSHYINTFIQIPLFQVAKSSAVLTVEKLSILSLWIQPPFTTSFHTSFSPGVLVGKERSTLLSARTHVTASLANRNSSLFCNTYDVMSC